MNICHVMGNPPSAMNGVVTSAILSSTEQRALGHDSRLVFPNRSHRQWSTNTWHALPGFALPGQGDYRAWLAGPGHFVRLFTELATQIVHAHHLFQTGSLALVAARQLDLPLVVTMHTDLENYGHYIPLPFLPNTIRQALMRHHVADFLNRVDRIIVPTAPVGELLESYGVHRPIVVNPTGIRVADYRKQASDQELETLGIDPHRPFLLFVGRLAREKNPWLLIEAFVRHIGPRHSDLQLVLVGPGPWEKAIRRFVAKQRLEKSIVVVGRLVSNRLRPIFRRALLFVYPSVTDTQAIVIVEAMAAGLAVVAIRRLGPAAIVRDGLTGTLVQHFTDPGQRELQIRWFAQAIHELIVDEDVRRRYGSQAEIEAQQYDLSVTVPAQLAVYQALL